MWQSSAQLPGGTTSVPSQPMWFRCSGSPLGSRSGHGVYFQPPGHGDSFKDGHRPTAGQPELTLEFLLEGDKYPQWHLWGPVGGLRGPQHKDQWSQEMEKDETLETLSTWIQLCLKLVGFSVTYNPNTPDSSGRKGDTEPPAFSRFTSVPCSPQI